MDPAETEHFKTMAADWWDPKGPCSVLHAINPIRLQFISDRFDYRAQPLLDLGCGVVFSPKVWQNAAQRSQALM